MCLSEWPKAGTLTTPNAGEDGNSTVTLEGGLGVSYKLNILLPYDPTVAFLDVYPKNLKALSTQKPAQRCVRQLCS